MSGWRRLAVVPMLWLALSPLCALADVAPGPPPAAGGTAPAPKADSEGFVPVSMPADMTAAAKEKIPATPLVAAAYSFIWVAVLVYVGSVATRTSKLGQEIAALRKRIDETPAAGR